jgi:hypothetical protein
MRIFHAVLFSFGLFTAACATSDVPPASDDPAQADDPGASDDDALVSSVASALTANVAAGCVASVTCPGTKTCTPFSSFTTCGDAISECCGIIGRNGHCSLIGQTLPQNRTRTCVMRATGATCVEIQYRELSGCPTE